MNIKTKQALSVVLALVSSAGTIATAILAVKGKDKEDELKKKMLDTNIKPSKTDILKLMSKAYWPAIAAGTATISSTLASHILSKKVEVSLITGSTLLAQGWQKYKYKIKDYIGEDEFNKLTKGLSEKDYDKLTDKDKNEDNGRVLYYMDEIGYFKADPVKLAYAYSNMNQRIHTIDQKHKTAYFCLLYDILKDCDAEFLDKTLDDMPSDNLNWGWTEEYLRDKYGAEWIHMHQTRVEENGRKYTIISFDEKPIFDPSNGGSSYWGYDNSEEQNNYKEVVIENGNAKNN
jgi:hypothetical protein